MAREIERKFLVKKHALDTSRLEGKHYSQGYFDSKGVSVRVRISSDSAFLSVKGSTHGVSRHEFEYPVSLDDARLMLELFCSGRTVEKKRFEIWHEGHLWEVDEFLGENLGLVVAEIELQSEDEPFQIPPWAGDEVSHDPRYYNSNLALTPCSKWKGEGS